MLFNLNINGHDFVFLNYIYGSDLYDCKNCGGRIVATNKGIAFWDPNEMNINIMKVGSKSLIIENCNDVIIKSIIK